VDARHENGVLFVRIPKSDEVKRRTISIK